MRRINLVLISATLLIVAACATEGGDTTTTAGDDGGATTTAGDDGGATTTAGDDGGTSTTAGGGETTSTGGATGDGVQAAESDLGTILVDPEGFTLYIFTADTGGESTCYDSCAQTWPPVPGDTPIGGDLDAALFSTVARTDGTEQLTVDGQPLYRYTPDANPGDTSGQGVGGVWFVVGTDGAMIDGSEAAGEGRADY